MSATRFLSWFAESSVARIELLSKRPLQYFVSEAVRVAGLMALLLAILDAASIPVLAETAGARLRFLVFFGLLIAIVNLLTTRALLKRSPH